MRFVGVGVFPRERIREVRVKNERPALLHNQKPALTEPPEAARARFEHTTNVSDESVVLSESRFQASLSSRRTIFTPSTIFLSFCLAAQRAVWLKPQSGANASR